MILLDDSGFRTLLSTPQLLAKNAPLAFLMFSSIHLLLESEVDHHALRHWLNARLGFQYCQIWQKRHCQNLWGDYSFAFISIQSEVVRESEGVDEWDLLFAVSKVCWEGMDIISIGQSTEKRHPLHWVHRTFAGAPKELDPSQVETGLGKGLSLGEHHDGHKREGDNIVSMNRWLWINAPMLDQPPCIQTVELK